MKCPGFAAWRIISNSHPCDNPCPGGDLRDMIRAQGRDPLLFGRGRGDRTGRGGLTRSRGLTTSPARTAGESGLGDLTNGGETETHHED